MMTIFRMTTSRLNLWNRESIVPALIASNLQSFSRFCSNYWTRNPLPSSRKPKQWLCAVFNEPSDRTTTTTVAAAAVGQGVGVVMMVVVVIILGNHPHHHHHHCYFILRIWNFPWEVLSENRCGYVPITIPSFINRNIIVPVEFFDPICNLIEAGWTMNHHHHRHHHQEQQRHHLSLHH